MTQGFRPRSGQRGLSFIGLLFVAVIAACFMVVAAQVFPTIIEYQAVVKAVKAWSCPDDGNAHAWEHEGKLYARNFTNDVWNRNADGNVTTWAGAYLPAEDRIDETVPEPIYADE